MCLTDVSHLQPAKKQHYNCGPILTTYTSHDMVLCKVWGLAMIAPALEFLVVSIFKITINSLRLNV